MEKVSNTKKVVKGVTSQSIVTVAIGLVEIISFSIMSRILTETDFGYYAALTAISAVFYSLADTGIGAAIVQRRNLDTHFINNAFTLSFIIGCMLTIGMFASSGVLAGMVADLSIQKPLMIFSVTLLFFCISSIDISLLQRELKFFHIGFVRLTSLIVTTFIAIILALRGWGYYAILTKSILDGFITAIVAFLLSKRKIHFELDKSVCKQIFGFSGWLLLSAFFRNIANQIDRLLMPRLFSIATLGLYTRPKDFINTIANQSGSIFDMVLFPVLSGMQDNKEKMVTSYKYALYYINLFAMILTMAVAFNSEFIIRLFLGDKWLHINILLIILSFSFICLMNGKICDIFLRSLGKTQQQFYFRIAQFVVTTLLVIFGSKYNVIGVALSFIVSLGIIVAAKMLYISKHVCLTFSRSIIEVLQAYQLFVIMLPLYGILQVFLENNLLNNTIKLLVFCIMASCSFLLLPSLVGATYKREAYTRIMTVVQNKFNEFLYRK